MKPFSAPSLLTIAAVLCSPGLGFCQAPAPSAPSASASEAHVAGAPHVKLEMVPSLIVLNAHGASLKGQMLSLNGVSPNSIVFADRPIRAAGHLLTSHLLEEWASDGSFSKDPPNATVSVLSSKGDSAHDAVVELRSPHLDGDRLTFDVRVLEGDLAGADGPASVFVDIIGMPLTPLSYAGVARRTARRAYWYSAAVAPRYYPPPAYYPPPYYAPPYPSPYSYPPP
jgi:hypothetical protein